MSVDRINWLNIGLMLGTLAAAFSAPFHVFLAAYAVLGPLHYFTEISWLHDREYYAPRKPLRRGWLVLVAAAMLAVIGGYVGSELMHREVTPIVEMSLVAIVFLTAAAAAFATFRITAIAVAVAAALVIASVSSTSSFAIAAYLLITMVHVLLFTGCFILSGAMKSRHLSGFLSFAVFCGCTGAAGAVLLTRAGHESVPAAYAPFQQLNQVLLSLTGNAHAAVDSGIGRRVMQLIAFAYTYHYLNWFSKTSVIRWHEVSARRAVTIVAAWLGSIAVYFYDFRIGFSLLYALSILHVLLEFPLDHVTLAGLLRSLRPAPMRRVARAS